jgi:hypothetical protein
VPAVAIRVGVPAVAIRVRSSNIVRARYHRGTWMQQVAPAVTNPSPCESECDSKLLLVSPFPVIFKPEETKSNCKLLTEYESKTTKIRCLYSQYCRMLNTSSDRAHQTLTIGL